MNNTSYTMKAESGGLIGYPPEKKRSKQETINHLKWLLNMERENHPQVPSSEFLVVELSGEEVEHIIDLLGSI